MAGEVQPGLFYHKITDPDVLASLDQLRAAFQSLAAVILATCPQNRYRSLAVTDLEAASMRAVQAVVTAYPSTRQGQGGPA